jgi:hypothetical protein
MYARRSVRMNRGRVRDGAAAAVTVWTPASLTGADLMLEASAGITLNGSNVAAWADQSGAGNHYAEATLQPTYSATDGPGARATVRFPNLGTGLVTAARLVGPTYAATAADMFVVAKKLVSPGAGADGSGGIHEFQGAAASGSHVPYHDGLHYLSAASTSRRDSIASPGSAATWFLQEIISTATEYTARWNRSQYYTTGTNTVAWPASATRIGCSVAGNAWWEGDISAVYKFSRKLTSDERTLVEAYILTKWGV